MGRDNEGDHPEDLEKEFRVALIVRLPPPPPPPPPPLLLLSSSSSSSSLSSSSTFFKNIATKSTHGRRITLENQIYRIHIASIQA